MVKWVEEYWRPMGIKSYESTYEKHYGQIKKAKDIPYKEIVDDYFEEEVIQHVHSGFPGRIGGSGWFSGVFQPEVKEKGGITKTTLRSLKGTVNWRTRELITHNLVQHGYPKSWDTAFYMAHYEKINNMMKRIVKEIVKNYV